MSTAQPTLLKQSSEIVVSDEEFHSITEVMPGDVAQDIGVESTPQKTHCLFKPVLSHRKRSPPSNIFQI
jgi:hypothetical protein